MSQMAGHELLRAHVVAPNPGPVAALHERLGELAAQIVQDSYWGLKVARLGEQQINDRSEPIFRGSVHKVR